MANYLKMANVQAIHVLRGRGWSQRRIARELGVDRETVARYLRLAASALNSTRDPPGGGVQNQPNPPAGKRDQNQPNLPAGSEGSPEAESWVPGPIQGQQGRPDGGWDQDPPNPPIGSGGQSNGLPGSSGPDSLCEPFRQTLLDGLERGLSAQRIWQDLTSEHGFAGCYDSVKRFIRRLKTTGPLPFRRMECAPAAEAQIDFGTGAPIVAPDGRRRKTYVFRIVLSHSRKGYSEVVFRQTTEAFLRCIENAFWHFGGVPQTLVIDNLKAAVTKADWYDPELNPKILAFCEYYGTVLLPTRPYTPRHKGKIERGVDYVQENALRGRTFESLDAQNRHLLEWETRIADTRIHGTTRKHVGRVFEGIERPALLGLPPGHFPSFTEVRRTVHRDGHVEVDKSYYSVPPEYLGHQVWVRFDTRLVRVFDQRMRQIVVHRKRPPGEFSTHSEHIVHEKISSMELGAARLTSQASRIGPHTGQWAEQMLKERGVQSVRVLMGLLNLAKKHPADCIEKACQTATSHGAFGLKILRKLLQRQAPPQEQFEFIDQHPIIRSLREYQAVVEATFETKAIEHETQMRHKDHERECAKRAQEAAAVGHGRFAGYPAAGSRFRRFEPRRVPRIDHPGRAAGPVGPVDPAKGEGRGLPGDEDTGRLRLAVQPVDQEEAGVRPGDVPVHPAAS